MVLRSLLILFFFTHFSSISQNNEPQTGEKIDFLVSFGIINAGKASMITDSLKHTYNGKDVYKVKVTGKSIGLFDFFTRVRDEWGVYISKDSLKPKSFYRYLEEGKYRTEEKYPRIVLRLTEGEVVVQLKVELNALRRIGRIG